MPRALLLALVLPLLSGCSALSALGDATQPLDVYELQPPAEVPVARRSQARDVIVELPTTSGALETDRIMIRPDRLAATYLPGVRWGEPAPVMVQTVLLRTLDATGAFQYVGRRPLGPSGDYAIVTELVEFEAEVLEDGDSARIDIRLTSRIVREDGVRIVAARTFTSTATAASLDDTALVEAFDAAMGPLARDFAGWVLATLGAG
ncbi:hypothetical protein HCU73_15025 [Roseibacterium sp. KMU-115]|uniref:ABC-type transport auxiliary lipoprotein component domain-containing protein n=2 Tax=Roseicyclus persicicus TaxID=2650661 RepID=A0A7X6H0R0_9RHOB|nr:ABC-type transport auxiliary lipoprotein family protein [Roseibacterium persicicum]NKX45906.1 hypothetical protein [Roseibacterium persicicum]